VFADDSDDDPCSWRREARALASHGYAVAVFQAGGGDEARQALTIGAALRRTGPRGIVLIGASVGARAVLQAGAMRPHGIQGLVALSAERRIGSSGGSAPTPATCCPRYAASGSRCCPWARAKTR
jgi:pimeloyl-ACP methyl ester carboxylesterase